MYSSVLSNTFRRMKIKICVNILILISGVIILVTVRHTLRGFKKIPIPTKYSDVIHTQSDSNSKLVEDLLSLVLIISFMHNNSILEQRMLIKK